MKLLRNIDVHHALNLARRITELTDAPVEFGQIDPADWYQPEWIDEIKASAARDKMQKDGPRVATDLPLAVSRSD